MVRSLQFLSSLLLLAAGVWSEDSPPVPAYNEKFTTALMKALSGEGKNIIFSPLSIDTALGIVGYGARDNTAEEVFKVLGYPPDQAKHLLAEKQKIINKEQSEGAIWQTANRIMTDFEYPLLKDYLTEIEEAFPGVSHGFINFNDLKGVSGEVNNWVSNKTNNFIKELLNEGDLDSKTRMIILNAMYFKGSWKKAFIKTLTREECFYSEPGKCTLTDMMHITQSYKLLFNSDLNAQIIEFPYENDNFSMIVVLPYTTSNLTSLMNNLDVDEIISIVDTANVYRTVEVTFPKFVIEFKSELSNVLKMLGIEQIFTQAADLTGMAAGRVYVDGVIHKAKIICDEEGTVATSTTAVTVLGRSLFARPEKLEFIADRPFFYLLREKQAGVLFAGQKVNV